MYTPNLNQSQAGGIKTSLGVRPDQIPLVWNQTKPDFAKAYIGYVEIGYVSGVHNSDRFTFKITALKGTSQGFRSFESMLKAKQALQERWDWWCARAGLINPSRLKARVERIPTF